MQNVFEQNFLIMFSVLPQIPTVIPPQLRNSLLLLQNIQQNGPSNFTTHEVVNMRSPFLFRHLMIIKTLRVYALLANELSPSMQ